MNDEFSFFKTKKQRRIQPTCYSKTNPSKIEKKKEKRKSQEKKRHKTKNTKYTDHVIPSHSSLVSLSRIHYIYIRISQRAFLQSKILDRNPRWVCCSNPCSSLYCCFCFGTKPKGRISVMQTLPGSPELESLLVGAISLEVNGSMTLLILSMILQAAPS